MKIGLFAPLTNPYHTPEYVSVLGRTADERGFHSIWLGEHVVLFDDYLSTYPYAGDGRIPLAPQSNLLETFTALSFMAAETKQLRLGTGICLVPQRNPVYTAKEAAAVDYLSNGRLDFGVGVGWLKEEFDALGVPFERRGARCREYLEVIRQLWCEEISEHQGEFYTLPACRQYPKPVQTPHPPIHFGGESEVALKRVADLGQGWYGFNLMQDAAVERIGRLDELLRERGRGLDDIEISVSPYLNRIDLDGLKRYRDAGVDQVILLAVSRDLDKMKAQLDSFAETFVVPGQNL